MLRRTKTSRIRRIGKWAGLVACVLIAGGWAASMRCSVGYRATHAYFGLSSGSIVLSFLHPSSSGTIGPPGPTIGWRVQAVYWWPRRESWMLSGPLVVGWYIVVPLWIPFAAFAIPTAWLGWRDRGPPLGHCRCGYDLAGLAPGAACPECGASSIRGDSLRHGGPSARTPLPEKSL